MNYLNVVKKAIDYIENNLQNKISLDDIASEACISKYHFHRIFTSTVGETIGSYVRKRRLTEASYELINTNNKQFEIALDYQFESQQAFSRSFKKHFEISPGQYRKIGTGHYLTERKQITSESLRLLAGLSIKPSTVKIEDKKLIGMKIATSINNSRSAELWSKFTCRINEIENRVDQNKFYEFRIPDEDFDLNNFTEDTDFYEFAGTEVENFDNIPDGMLSQTIPGGNYIVFTHKGKTSDLFKIYEYIWGTWLPNSGYNVEIGYDFELYDERFTGPMNKESEIDIYIPIKKQTCH